MKKILAFLMSVIMAFSLTACCNLDVLDMLNPNNRLCAENIKFVKNVDTEVTVTVCSAEESYVEYMDYYARNYYSVTPSTQSEYDALCEYFTMTQKMLEQYEKYNKKIDVEYVDPQSIEFMEITTDYPDYGLAHGDMIVTATVNGKERVKGLKFDDIYYRKEDANSSYYGNPSYTLEANQLETALTSAIAYVTNTDIKKVAMLSGHSNGAYDDAYIELLETNNYEVVESDARIIKSISNDYDAIVIAAPTMDFTSDEIAAISDFLDNDGKLGKGLIFFGDAAGPSLPNLYDFLKQWGIEINDGIVFETDSSFHMDDSPSAIGIIPVINDGDDITDGLNFAIANYNVPMKVCDASSYERKATALMQTSENTVIAPIGAGKDWSDYTDYNKQQFDCVIQSVETAFDINNNEVTSYVMAFSSVEFIQSDWVAYDSLSNQDIVMACTERACHINDTSMVFNAKVVHLEEE